MRRGIAVVGLALLGGVRGVTAQDQRDEQFYYPGGFNWVFLKTYPEGGRLFNAFDYGHAVLYERLLTKPAAERDAALEKEYQFLTTDLLIRPPRFAVAEEVIEPSYAKLAWQAKQMFDWAHMLHRQIYDLYADERLNAAERDALIERVTDYYLSRKDYAFVAVPKAMALMEEQPFSQVFRKAHPKFNGLIWAYHWLQVGLYEPLLLGKTPAEKKAGVKATLARFWSMLEAAPENFPRVMPMTSAIAPNFSARHPRAAMIFDNLHMMHDIISDILVAETIPRAAKRQVIYQQLAEFRDSTQNVMSMEHWHHMAELMGGVAAMGGPATGLLEPPPAGPAMPGMEHGAARSGRPDTAAHAPTPDSSVHVHPAAPVVTPARDTATRPTDPVGPRDPAGHVHPAAPTGARRAAPQGIPPADSARTPAHEQPPMARDSLAGSGLGAPASPGSWLPMHSGHPLIVHFPLVALLLAVLLDTVAVARGSTGWRSAGTLLWGVGLAGAAAAIVTGLLAYSRVDHSDLAHESMTTHRNLALAAMAFLLGAAIWRWRRPLSRGAVGVGIVGAVGLATAAYLGGELVYRHGLGIPTAVLRQVHSERTGSAADLAPGPRSQDTLAVDSLRQPGGAAPRPHTHAPGKEHEP